ncbi:MAG: NosD domain-containing protein [Gemmatimonadota bacterium]
MRSFLTTVVVLSTVASTVMDAQASHTRIRLSKGLVISASGHVAPGVYRLGADTSLAAQLITISGNDIDVDFRGATLEGTAPTSEPDEAAGVAILVNGGRNVTIRNATIRGYKIAILARGTRNLRLIDNDLRFNWKPRLYSLIEHESLADWLSHHKNEKDEWLRFGAAAYLTDVTGGEIRGNRAEQGMEGLMLTRCDSIHIVGNTISFNSGVGIGLYRSNDNVIMHNRVDYNVRGYSHGFFRRGQDSADLLIYEQSSRNVVAYNSMTHGGDGLFLWAGQSTMDTGAGGANDNLFYGNDFSFAPTNGMEATFSRNTFARNRIEGSDHGLWGGYSFGARVVENEFVRNRIGIAIEHGQNNEIVGNRFDRDGTAIQLWANTIEPSDWQYPRKRDTRSTGYRIEGNTIAGEPVGMRISDTRDSRIVANSATGVDSVMVFKDTAAVSVENGQPTSSASVADKLAPNRILGVPSALGDSLALRDRSAIIVNEWGPFDWKSPMLWPVDSARRSPLALRVLGPPGKWFVARERGVARVSRKKGVVGDTLVVTPARAGDWQVDLQYNGAATVSPRGEQKRAGAPVVFSYAHFEVSQSWDVRFFAWPDSADPRTQADRFASLLRGTPLVVRQEPRLDYMWYRPTIKDVPQSKFAIAATSRVVLPAGTFTLRTISDDAIRVWVDGKLAIDNWTPHESAVDVAPVGGGVRDIRVEYFQAEGWTELRLDIIRGSQRAGGSPGPH